MTEEKPTPQEGVTTAQAQLADVVRQLRVLRYLLLGVAASLPEPETEAADLPAQIRSDVECVLADSLAPAIAGLERAARYTPNAAEES